ncbi:MAG TPA: outer membrane beta-barrel protein [Bryobacteraceae bacterium]|nr:outer membrane beta-barrel protein [Bryobacteraceae bacterium]
MRKLSMVPAVVLALTCASGAWGQTGELWFSYGRSLLQDSSLGTLSAFGGSPNDVKLDDGYRFSFRFGFNQGSHFGHEVQYAFNHTQFDQGESSTIGAGTGVSPITGTSSTTPAKQAMHFHQGGYNFLVYALPEKVRVRPFATAGVQFSDFVPPGGAINYGSQNKFGANFGGGVKIHVKGIWGVRFDVREYLSGKPNFNVLTQGSGALWQTEVSAGVGVGF